MKVVAAMKQLARSRKTTSVILKADRGTAKRLYKAAAQINPVVPGKTLQEAVTRYQSEVLEQALFVLEKPEWNVVIAALKALPKPRLRQLQNLLSTPGLLGELKESKSKPRRPVGLAKGKVAHLPKCNERAVIKKQEKIRKLKGGIPDIESVRHLPASRRRSPR